MGLGAMQKTTLLDFPGRVACTVFANGCDFRCPFCHNGTLVANGGDFDENELWEHLERRRGIIDGVAITGGEPTLLNGLLPMIERIKSMGFEVKLDTNGNHPDILKEAVESGIDYVAMDIKNCREKYGLTVGIDGFNTAKVEESVDFLKSGAVDYEFRTTVVDELHNASDMEKIALWINGAKRYYLQGFRDNGDLLGTLELHAAPKERMEEYLALVKDSAEVAELRGID